MVHLRRSFNIVALSILILVFGSCQNYVRDVASPVDLISSNDLYQESQLPLVFTSSAGSFSQMITLIVPFASILSDEFISANDISLDRSSPGIFNLDAGIPDRSLTDDMWGTIGSANGLIRLLNGTYRDIKIPITITQDSNRKKLTYFSNLLLGMYLHYTGAFFGRSPRVGGITIPVYDGLFFSTTMAHDSALSCFSIALINAQTVYERRLVNSYIARIHLLEGRYAQALNAALNGLQQTDSAFQATFPATARNRWVDYAGNENGHTVIPHQRFRAYIVAEPGEAGRIPLALGNRPASGHSIPYYVQAKYTSTSPIDLMTWQENSLMIAELRLRLSNDMTGALQEINRVRSAVSPVQGSPLLAPRTTTNLDSIYIERDKQLFGTGLRLLDQRRFNRWSQFSGAILANAWYYLPISQNEFNVNHNLIP